MIAIITNYDSTHTNAWSIFSIYQRLPVRYVKDDCIDFGLRLSSHIATTKQLSIKKLPIQTPDFKATTKLMKFVKESVVNITKNHDRMLEGHVTLNWI